MKIAVYDKYWDTMGGGEKYGGAIASYLSKKHDVDLVSIHQFDKKKLASRLGLDLSKVNVRYVEEFLEKDLADIFSEYDLLINNTFYSRIPCKSEKGVLIVFFPEIRSSIIPIFMKRLFKDFAKLFFSEFITEVDYKKGFFWNDVVDGRSGRWTSDKFILDFKKSFSKIILRLKVCRDSKENVFKKVTIDGKEVPFRVKDNELIVETQKRYKPSTVEFELVKDKSEEVEKTGIFLENTVTDSSSFLTKLIFNLWRLPVLGKVISSLYRKYLQQVEFFMDPDFVETYDLVVSISDYSKKWTDQIFETDSFKLIPPIDVDTFKPGEKKNKILSVGRFFVGSHNKKQLEMIKVFKEMYEENSEMKDFEYHLCGGTHEEEIHQKYLKECKKEAEGYPVFIHTDVSFEELKAHYGDSLIFWHGSGWGEDPDKDPVKFEHFGITTAESMAAGCIPVVIGMAGQTEVVQDGVNGYLFHSKEELKNKTLRIINDDDLREKLRKNSKKRVEKISFDSFFRRVKEMMNLLKTKN